MWAHQASLVKEMIGAAGLLTLAVALALAGCQKPREKVLDIETPGVDIEVQKSPSEGGAPPDRTVDIEVPRKSDN
jgi:hypothetical protein